MNKLNSYFLVLGITQECNLNCSYCYMGKHGNKRMPDEVIKKAIDQALFKARSVHVQFTGGEPSLYIEGMRKTVDYLKKKDARYILSLQTNAMTLSEEMIEFIKANRIGLGISCDGFFENSAMRGNNDFRVYSRKLLQSLMKLSEHGIKTGITCVVTAVNVKRLNELFDFLSALNSVVSLHLSPVRLTGNAENKIEMLPSQSEYESRLHELSRKAEQYSKWKGAGNFIRLRFLETVKNNPMPFKDCHLINDSGCFVNVYGEIYPCPSLSTYADYLLGDVFIGIDKKRILKVAVLFKDKMKKCYDCHNLNQCSGGCFARELNHRQGEFYKCLEFRVANKVLNKEFTNACC